MKKTIKSTPAQKENVTIVNPAKETNLQKINLDKFADSLEKFEGKEKKSKETSIYKYPESFPKEDVNSEKGKNWRNQKRGKIKRFVNNILLYAKHKRMEDLQKEISEFKTFYAETYILNDYSGKSISNSNKEKEVAELSIALDIVKQTI